jgi:hypothetical protein
VPTCRLKAAGDTCVQRGVAGTWREQGTHRRCILNSSFPLKFVTKVKGGRGSCRFFLGKGMVPAQRLMYHFPKSWAGGSVSVTSATEKKGEKRREEGRKGWVDGAKIGYYLSGWPQQGKWTGKF